MKRKYNDFSSVIELILSAFRAIHVKTTKYTWEKINQICEDIVKIFIEQNCKAIVIACNTASAKSAQYLRNKYSHIPFIAIEPAYSAALEHNAKAVP